MIKKTITGVSVTDIHRGVANLISNLDEYIQTKFNNVVFVETFTFSSAIRYTYLIDGVQNLYFCVENSISTSDAQIIFSLKKADQIKSTSNATASNSLAVFNANTNGTLQDGFKADFYFMSYNGRLKGITCAPFGGITPFFYYITENNNKYVLTDSTGSSVGNTRYIYTDEEEPARVYLQKNGSMTYSPADALLLKRNAIIIGNDVYTNAGYISLISDLWNFYNTSFYDSLMTLVEIDGARYRQIGKQNLFALEGDTE